MMSNNPAGRLLHLFNEGKKPQYRDKLLHEAWGRILDVPENNKSLLLKRLGLVIALPSQIRAEFEKLPNQNEKLYLKWLPAVETAFSNLNLQASWGPFISSFDPSIIYGLEITSDLLSSNLPEPTASDKQLDALMEQLDELLKSLSNSDMDRSHEEFMLKHLLKVKNALQEYQIRGLRPLTEEFHLILGEVALNPKLYEDLKTIETGSRFWDLFGKLALIVTVTVGVIQIGNHSIDFLTHEKEANGEVIEVGTELNQDKGTEA